MTTITTPPPARPGAHPLITTRFPEIVRECNAVQVRWNLRAVAEGPDAADEGLVHSPDGHEAHHLVRFPVHRRLREFEELVVSTCSLRKQQNVIQTLQCNESIQEHSACTKHLIAVIEAAVHISCTVCVCWGATFPHAFSCLDVDLGRPERGVVCVGWRALMYPASIDQQLWGAQAEFRPLCVWTNRNNACVGAHDRSGGSSLSLSLSLSPHPLSLRRSLLPLPLTHPPLTPPRSLALLCE